MKKHPIQPYFSIPARFRGGGGGKFDSSNTEFLKISMRYVFITFFKFVILEKFCGAIFDFRIIFLYLAAFQTFGNFATDSRLLFSFSRPKAMPKPEAVLEFIRLFSNKISPRTQS